LNPVLLKVYHNIRKENDLIKSQEFECPTLMPAAVAYTAQVKVIELQLRSLPLKEKAKRNT
jgi:hypothetical protein